MLGKNTPTAKKIKSFFLKKYLFLNQFFITSLMVTRPHDAYDPEQRWTLHKSPSV
jgi:hypothetical protein